jgi:hypothetical protein
MLSEAYDLRRSLDETGFDIPTNHPDVKKPGKNPGYRVGLGDNGLPHIVEEVDRESMGRLWYHREGKHNAFPVVKIQHALLLIPIDDPLRKQFDALKRTEQAQRLKLLREAIDNRDFQLLAHDEQTWNRLRSKALDWLNIFAEVDEHYLALPCMLRRFVESMVSPADVLRRLCQLIVQRLEQGHLQEVTLAQKLLVGVPDKKRPTQPAKAEVPVVLDVAEPDYRVSVADPKMGSYVSRWLRANEKRANEKKEPDGICALQGVPRHLLKRRFPEPKLGALGESKLFSKNKDTPCEFRYLKNPADWEDASKSFPIDQWIAADIADGLSALTMPDLRGKTWRMVANGKWEGSGRNKREKKDLLLVYCEGQPVISEEAADTFGSDEKERRDQFENDAKALCRALEGIIKLRPQSRLHLLLIGKADKEKKQILMHMTLAPQEMLDAAERWQQGVRKNLPTVTLSFPPKIKGQKDIYKQALPPYPDRVVRLLSSKWVRGGTDELKLDGPALRQVLDLMLRSSGKCEEVAKNLLRLTIQRIGPLLVGVAAAFHSGEKNRIEKFKPVKREAALQAVAVLGILLDALESRKEIYMKEAPYQIGQVLALADTLHKDYCIVVRKGQLPNSLIGTSLMRRALDSPAGALADLSERMMEYIRWAKIVKVSQDWPDKDQRRIAVNEARKKLRQYQPLAERLGISELPIESNDMMKAQLLLGFLATPPAEEQTEEGKEKN